MEHFDVVKLFARTGKLDRLARDRLYGERGAASGIAVELCEDNAGYFEQVVEALRYVDRVLTCHRVDNEENLVGVDLRLDLFELVHQHLVDVETAGGIEDNHVVAVVLRVTDCRPRDFDGVLGAHLENGDVCLGADNLELIDSRGAVDVAGDEHGAAVLRLEHLCELRRVGRFT